MRRYAALLFLICGAQGQVTFDRIVNAAKEPQNWLTYWGDYSAVRHRALDQINTGNIRDLRLDWVFQTGQTGAFETVPLVVDGVMYLTAPEGYAFAVDAASGRQLWTYKYAMPPKTKAVLRDDQSRCGNPWGPAVYGYSRCAPGGP